MTIVKNKKGQDLPIVTLVLVVLAIMVLVIVAIGFFYGWDFIFGKIGLLPGQKLEVFTQGCIIAAKANLQTDYCEQFKLINDLPGQSKPTYINCLYVANKIESPLTECTSEETKKFADNFCNGIKEGSLIYNGTSVFPCPVKAVK